MTPELPLTGIDVALGVAASFAAAYLLVGLVHDLGRWRLERARARAQRDLAAVLFEGDEDAAAAAERLASAPRRMLLDMVQRLAADLDGEADERLRKLVTTAGLHRSISAHLRSRSWRRRAQGAALAPLLPRADPLRVQLLADPHPIVRARIAESLEASDVVEHADELTRLLDHDVDAVKFAAQQALLRSDARIVPALERYLTTATGSGVGWALEVAANMPDPRLVPAMELHARAEEPRRRAIAIGALAPWLTDTSLLTRGFADPTPVVRATAVAAAGMVRAERLAAQIGRLLGDEAWAVRQQAGQALAALGPAGTMTLRMHLDDPDPYAQDMARQVLDTIEAGTGRRVPIPAGRP